MRRAPTWPVAAGSLVLGFAVAQASGVRPLGAIVLAAGLAWCVACWLRAGLRKRRGAALIVVYVVAFAGSHVLADLVGTWPAVLVAAGVAGLAVWAVADVPGARRPARSGEPQPQS